MISQNQLSISEIHFAISINKLITSKISTIKIIIIQSLSTKSEKVTNLKCERSQCHRKNARLYRALLSLDVLKVAMLTVISEVTVTVSESLFQTAGAAWQKAFLEKLRVAGLYRKMFAPRGLSYLGASHIRISSDKYCGSYIPIRLAIFVAQSIVMFFTNSYLDIIRNRSTKTNKQIN